MKTEIGGICKIAVAIGLLIPTGTLNRQGNYALAQTSNQIVVTAAQSEMGIQFYAISSSGNPIQIGSLPADFRVGQDINDTSWTVIDQDMMVVSASRDYIAFTATKGRENALYIYDLTTASLKQVMLPGSFQAVWASDDTALLLSPCCGSDLRPPYNDYVYDVTQSRLIQLDFPESNGHSFQWLPDSSGFIYIRANNLAFISRNGTNRRILSDLSSQAPAAISAEVCNFAWSKTQMRLYYAVGCVGGGEESHEYLYSTDVSGNIRAEMASPLSSLYPDDEYVEIVKLETTAETGGVFITLASEDGSNNPDGLECWRVLHLNADGNLRTIYENRSEETLLTSSISPDGEIIVLRSRARGATDTGILEVISLTSGQVLINRGGTGQEVCDASWLDNENLLYSVDSEGKCSVISPSQSLTLLKLNTTNGNEETLDNELGGTGWIVRK